MEYITLNNSIIIPKVGLGTFGLSKENFINIINFAYSVGYRLLDTAWKYQNESLIGKSIKDLHIDRKNLFITTKFSEDSLYRFGYFYGKKKIFNIPNFKSIRNIIFESFRNLNTDYIDLFLIHWPYPKYLKVYEILSDLYNQGKIKAIGVSSFTKEHIESLKEVSDIIPSVNQIEISPLNTQKNLIEFCQQQGIAVEAMSTFSHFRSNEPRMEIFNNPILKKIAYNHNKTVTQIVLRWLTQQDIIVIPKSNNFEHIKENIDIFDFNLSDQEMMEIDSLDQGKCLNYNPYASHVIKSIPKKYR